MNPILRSKRVLIVEDEVDTGELIRSCVKGAEEFHRTRTLRKISDGFDVCELPHAALLEASLRDGSSVQVACHLETCGVPYAVLTSPTANLHPIELREALLLEKPVSPARLIETLVRLRSLPISRATSARTIVALVSGMIVVLVGIAGWFLYQAASDFNVVHRGSADRRLALRQEQSKSEALTGALATARQENESQATALKRANDRPDNSKQLAETQQALRQEQSKSEALTGALWQLRDRRTRPR